MSAYSVIFLRKQSEINLIKSIQIQLTNSCFFNLLSHQKQILVHKLVQIFKCSYCTSKKSFTKEAWFGQIRGLFQIFAFNIERASSELLKIYLQVNNI